MRTWRSLPIVLTAVIGSAASVGVFLLALSWQHSNAMLEFRQKADRQLWLINADLGDAARVLSILRAYIVSRDSTGSRDEFSRFTSALKTLSVGLRDVGWAPRVTDSDRQSFIDGVRASGLPEFDIRGLGKASEPRPIGDTSDHFPILYVEPQARNRSVLGFDLATEPHRAAAISRALATGGAAATSPVPLLTVPRPRAGVMSFIPVYSNLASETTAVLPTGLVFGAFEIDAMIENIVTERRRMLDVDIYVFDPAGPVEDRMIYWRSGKAQQPLVSEQEIRALPHVEGTVNLMDQSWGVLFLPSGGLPAGPWTLGAVTPLTIGLLLTAMIVAHLAVSLRRNARLEAMTLSLRETAEDLRVKADMISHVAHHDVLTGLPNRRMFNERLQFHIDHALGRRSSCALMLIDLDRFKPVNDSFGHAAGDAALCAVAERLRASVRQGDIVARLGGDEFAAILLSEYDHDALSRLAHRIIDAISEPIVSGGLELRVGATIGIARWPADATDGSRLLSAADTAMYAAKYRKRGTCRFFDATLLVETTGSSPARAH